MRVRILSERGGFPCGAEVDVEDVLASNWITAGDAEAIAVPAVVAVDAIETATAPAVTETTMKASARAKGRQP